MKKISYLLICLLGISIGLLIGRRMSGPAEIKPIEVSRTDTLTIFQTDTVRIIKPQPYEVVVRDTVYLQFPQYPQYPQGDVLVQEVKTYKDSSYTATISGINAYLEHIEVYPKTVTKYITTTEFVREKPKKWGFGVFADVKFYEKVYMPVGGKLTYRSNRWEFSGKVGKDLINNKVVGEAGANFDLIRF